MAFVISDFGLWKGGRAGAEPPLLGRFIATVNQFTQNLNSFTTETSQFTSDLNWFSVNLNQFSSWPVSSPET